VSQLSATRWTIVQAAQSGDEAALRAVCLKYWPAVVSYLRGRGLGVEAEDVAQEALVGLLKSALRKARPGAGRFRGLVFAIARNQLAKHVERERALKRGGGKVQRLGDVDVAAEEPDASFDREWLAALVQTGLTRLERDHPTYLEALKRCVLEEAPQAQVAKELGVTPGVVKKRVFRAKRKLTAYLREEVWSYASSPGEYESELRTLSALLGLDLDQPESDVPTSTPANATNRPISR
jgi:RNA polymerase sigma factor (sigma-70 family)